MVDSAVTVSGDWFKFFKTLAANLFRLLPFWNRLREVPINPGNLENDHVYLPFYYRAHKNEIIFSVLE